MQPDTLLLIFVFVFFGGFLIPLPQDAVLVLAGYYASSSGLNLVLAVIASALAVILSDTIIYAIARAESPLIDAVSKRIAPQTMAMLRKGFERHPYRAMFFIRLMVGLRIAAPILAGSFKMPLKKFQLHNAYAVAVYVPLFTTLGYFSYGSITELLDGLTTIEHVLAIAATSLIAIGISYYLTQRIRKHFHKETAVPKPS